jgi:hypothetical protein
MRTFEILLEGNLKDDEKRVLEEALEEAYLEKGFLLHNKSIDDNSTMEKSHELPTLKDVHRILLKKAKQAEAVWVKEYVLNTAKMVGRFTKKGSDFLARPSTLKLEKLTTSGLVDIVLKNLPDEEFRVLAGLSILQYLKERMRDEDWSPTKGLKLYVVLDEAWKIAKDDRSDAIMIVREGRKYKFSLIVASQNPTDINEAIFSNVGTTFVLNLKFQRYKDYVRGSLKYSDFVAEAIEKFGVGNAAVNLMFSQKTDFPRTFLLDKVHGEEPLQEIIITAGELELHIDRSELKRKLGFVGIDVEIDNLCIDSRIDALKLIELMEKNHIKRKRIVDILNYFGIDLETIRKLFARLRGERS